MPKLKSHKGLLKRVKVTGRGKVKHFKPGRNHINSHFPGSKTRDLRQPKYAKQEDLKKLEKMLGRRLKPADS